MAPSPTTILSPASPASDASYATWTDDPILDPITATVHIPFGLLLGNYIAALVLSTIFVSLRVHVRRVMVKEIAWDDWTLIAAQVSYVLHIFFVIGWGLNIQVNGMVEAFWTSSMLAAFWELSFVICTILVRGAIATFFLRAMPRFEYKKQRIIIIATFAVYSSFMIIFCFLCMWQCGNPLNISWAHVNDPCMNEDVIAKLPIVARALTMVLDWIMTLVPVYVVLRTTMTPRAKISVVGIMILAGIGSTTSTLSIVFNDLGVLEYPTDVPTFIIYIIFSLWENGAGIMAVSLAAMRPLFGKIKANLRGTDPEDQDVLQDGMYMGSAQTCLENEPAVNEDVKMPVALLAEIDFSGKVTSWMHAPAAGATMVEVAEFEA